jgi:hypothetical protein
MNFHVTKLQLSLKRFFKGEKKRKAESSEMKGAFSFETTKQKQKKFEENIQLTFQKQ